MDRPWMQHVAEGNPKHVEIPILSLTQLLGEAIATYPKHTAMTFFKNTYTYTDLDERIKQTACALNEMGVEKGIELH